MASVSAGEGSHVQRGLEQSMINGLRTVRELLGSRIDLAHVLVVFGADLAGLGGVNIVEDSVGEDALNERESLVPRDDPEVLGFDPRSLDRMGIGLFDFLREDARMSSGRWSGGRVFVNLFVPRGIA